MTERKNSPDNCSNADKNAEDQKPGFWQIVFSTLAAFIGVQSNKNRERDFKHGNIVVFVVAGIIFTTLFIVVVISVVRLVVGNLTGA